MNAAYKFTVHHCNKTMSVRGVSAPSCPLFLKRLFISFCKFDTGDSCPVCVWLYWTKLSEWASLRVQSESSSKTWADEAVLRSGVSAEPLQLYPDSGEISLLEDRKKKKRRKEEEMNKRLNLAWKTLAHCEPDSGGGKSATLWVKCLGGVSMQVREGWESVEDSFVNFQTWNAWRSVCIYIFSITLGIVKGDHLKQQCN